jgi:antitoxin ParD1/3/4
MAGTTEKLSITLPHDMAAMIRGKVRTGAYASSSEVIREALRLLQAQERTRELELADLRQKIAEGRASGEPVAAEQVFDRLEAKYAAAKRQG